MKQKLPKLPIGCKIPEMHADKGITYLEIHEGKDMFLGFYLFQHENENSPVKWDNFTDDIEDLIQDCKTHWNIEPSMWKSVPDRYANPEPEIEQAMQKLRRMWMERSRQSGNPCPSHWELIDQQYE